ncbi:hypothetical protein ACFQMM_00585 [Saliphagus sp. GCM10025308]
MNQVSFEAEQSTYSSQIGDALDGEPDVLMVVGFPQSGITLFRDYYSDYADDWDGSIIVPDGLIDSELPGEVGNEMEDVWGTAPSAAALVRTSSPTCTRRSSAPPLRSSTLRPTTRPPSSPLRRFRPVATRSMERQSVTTFP